MKKKLRFFSVVVFGVVLSVVAGACASSSHREKSEEGKVKDTSRDIAVQNKNAVEKSIWTTWSSKGKYGGLIDLSNFRDELIQNNLHDPHTNYSDYRSVDCSQQNTRFRSADGTCTDIERPLVGAAGVAFGRNVGPEFIDPKAEENIMIPNPALVSQKMFTRAEYKPVPFLNMLAATWIQFMNHDWLTHGTNKKENPHVVPGAGVTATVERTQDNLTDSKQYKSTYGKTFLNHVSHWWDGSQIYGSSQEEQNAVRSFSMGKLRVTKVNGRELLPKASDLDPASNRQNRGLEVTGFRDNWWVGLSLLHLLFVKEHNAIVMQLMKKHVRFDRKTNNYVWTNGDEVIKMTEREIDEHLFQTARLINAAVMAKIHTVEWTPAILPNPTLKVAMYANWYGIINPKTWSKSLLKNVNVTDWFPGTKTGSLIGGIVGDKKNDFGFPYNITEEFTSVYRLHSLLPEQLEFKTLRNPSVVKKVDFTETRSEKAYEIVSNADLKDLFYSFGTQLPGQLVLNNFPKFMQEFTVAGHGIMDLAMVDIMRDRERGVPRYNQFRRGILLKPINKYEDFFPGGKAIGPRQNEILAKFYEVYGKDQNGADNVEMIDLLVGTLSEEVKPTDFGFGETMFQIFILMASRRLMTDRFFTDDYNAAHYTDTGLKWIDKEGWLHQVIGRHMPELKPHMEGLETAFAPWK